MAKNWRSKRRKDRYYRKAKKEEYRSRAAYKLKQLDHKYDIIGPGDDIVDLGASPGGWSQVAAELTAPSGKVVAVDIDRFVPVEGVQFIRGDIRSEAVAAKIVALLPNGADVVLSDMSPNISGNYPYDHARSIDLCEHALEFASKILRLGGNLVVKMFYGDMSGGYVSTLRTRFDEVYLTHPPASRSTSSEVYVIALGFRRWEASPRNASSGRS
ncbi:MAG: RlmE family RNA methyltransferase [Methanobacteriota archaeon]|nr:MAG: RlmE family RNA methyltransferase [Euryarchaeota archaeon]